MKIRILIHKFEGGGYWAEVPAMRDCLAVGNDRKELIQNIYKAIKACLSMKIDDFKLKSSDQIYELDLMKEPSYSPDNIVKLKQFSKFKNQKKAKGH